MIASESGGINNGSALAGCDRTRPRAQQMSLNPSL